LVDNSLVLQNGAVVGEVNSGWLLRELLHAAAGILVALLESLKRGDGLTTEAKIASDCGPVELESCASLEVNVSSCSKHSSSISELPCHRRHKPEITPRYRETAQLICIN
jgi:hypothetical protein